MNDYLLSVILGIIEGLTEFLPVSSTAHIRLFQDLFDVDMTSEYWKMYSVVIQLGAILSVVVYFRRRLAAFIRTFPRGASGDRTLLTHPLSLTLLAFAITAGPAFMLDKKIGENLERLEIMGAALMLGGAVMWAIDALCTNPRTQQMEQVSFLQAIWIGAWQIVSAAFPGTSRSMATIAGGQVAGMSRSAALEFSFFLSIPTMFAATLYKLLKPVLVYLKHGSAQAAGLPQDAHQWLVLLVGFLVSFIVAWAVIAWFMNWVRSRGFVPFAVYRLGVGYLILRWLGGAQPAALTLIAILASICWIPGWLAKARGHSNALAVAALGWLPLLVSVLTLRPWVLVFSSLLWLLAMLWVLLQPSAAPVPATEPAPAIPDTPSRP